MAGSLEARMGNIEELCIIIIIIFGGGRLPGHGPVGDSAAGDTSRMEALMRIVLGCQASSPTRVQPISRGSPWKRSRAGCLPSMPS